MSDPKVYIRLIQVSPSISRRDIAEFSEYCCRLFKVFDFEAISEADTYDSAETIGLLMRLKENGLVPTHEELMALSIKMNEDMPKNKRSYFIVDYQYDGSRKSIRYDNAVVTQVS